MIIHNDVSIKNIGTVLENFQSGLYYGSFNRVKLTLGFVQTPSHKVDCLINPTT
jgi:hypothetical protein